jgi:hypothetical protein
MPLDAIGRDSVGLIVRCGICAGEPVGYVGFDDIVYEVLPPDVAAWSTLADFALSIRDAAAARDLDALRAVMAFDFTSSLVGVQNPDAAFAMWRGEEFESLDRVPSIMSQGLASMDELIWSAPLAFVYDVNYRGLRLGFKRRADGRWEWVYLIRGILG